MLETQEHRGEPSPAEAARDQKRLGFLKRHRRAIVVIIGLAAVVSFIYVVVPQLSGLSTTLARLRRADPWWIGLGVVLEAISLTGYVLLFRTVFSCHGVNIGWRESFEINLAGAAASKVLAAAGAGGVALTIWALRAAGLEARAIARRMLTFELLLYAVFTGAVLLCGLGIWSGVFGGRAPWTLTAIPAAVAAGVILITLSLLAVPADIEHRIRRRGGSSGRRRRLVSRLAPVPGTVRDAIGIVVGLMRQRRLGLVGAVMYWGFDIATLWVSIHAFGTPPAVASVVMAYYIGQLANLLPLPGGIGGVEGGMIGSLLAFGTQGSLAVLGVLTYRVISFWLPTIPGAVAYLRLRGTVRRWREVEPAAQSGS